eukprot:scaffold80708_cov75-Phaeocystis_antarctica.AAC.15
MRIVITSSGTVRKAPTAPPVAPRSASASSVSTSRSLKLCGELMMYDLRPSKTASWIAPKGTSRHSDALHARIALARPSLVPSTRCTATLVEGSMPLCTRDLIASAGARTTEPAHSPSAPSMCGCSL